ncbi:MAG: glycosyltransferase [Thermogutta sp.]
MNILHVAPIHSEKISGIRQSTVSLAKAQNVIEGTRVGLLISSNDTAEWRLSEVPVVTKHRLLQHRWAGSWVDRIAGAMFRPDLVVFHSTFIPFHARLAKELKPRGIPYIICPRGGMTREALAYKAWKKWLGRHGFFDNMVAGATAIQYLTQGEFEQSGDWGRPVLIVGNGVWPPDEAQRAHPGSKPGRNFLFVGRLHVEHKGLDILIDAVARCQAELRKNRVQVRIVGPDCYGSATWLVREITQRSLNDIVILKGPVEGEAKAREYKAADLFLHISRSEGHPTAVLEALSYGLPVLVTPQTNVLAEVVGTGAGWGVTCDPGDVARQLVRVSCIPSSVLAAVGEAARRYAVTELHWSRVAVKTLEKYRQIIRVARRVA